MADNSTNSNRDWQAWLAEQGLDSAPSAQPTSKIVPGADDVSNTSVQQAAYTQPTVPVQSAAVSTQNTQSTQNMQGAQSAQGIQNTYSAQSAQGVQGAQNAPYASVTQPTAASVTAAPSADPSQPAAAQPSGYYAASSHTSTTTHAGPSTTASQAQAVPGATPSSPNAAHVATKSAAKSNKKSGGGFKTFALGFLGAACAVALGAGILGAAGYLNKAEAPADVTETVSDGGTVVLGSETNTTVEAVDNHTESLAEAVADKVLPSIVGIDVYATMSGDYGTFWGAGSTESEALAGLGSGVVISKDGYILTNYHVVEGATKVMATVGGEELEATVVGTDESSDLAVIKVEASDLTPVEIGSSDNLRAGQWVMTLGSPFGLEQSVATGIISATSRTVVIQNSSLYSYGQQVQPSIYSNMIQTDAAINPGNSGGALVDEDGKLIGINSVIESYSGSYSGVGFAIPVDYAMNIATQIIDGKTPTHAQLGVACTSVTKDLAERYGLGATSGAYINKIYEGSGALEAGLEQGDIITKLAGVAVESSTDLIAQVRAHNVGETVTVTFVRGTETKEAEVTLGSDENNASMYEQEQQQMPNEGYPNIGDGNGNGGQGFSYEDLEELFNYFQRQR